MAAPIWFLFSPQYFLQRKGCVGYAYNIQCHFVKTSPAIFTDLSHTIPPNAITRNFSCSTAYIYNHVSFRLHDIDTDTDAAALGSWTDKNFFPVYSLTVLLPLSFQPQ
jgi:hypothetical protein